MILQGITDGVIVQDATGHLLYANDAAARLLGSPAAQALAEMLPQPQIDVLDELGNPFPLDRLPERAACRGPQQPPVLLRFRHRDTGTERWSMVKTQEVLNEQEQSTLVVSIFQDITELRRAEQSQHILAEASRLLAVSLDYASGLANLVRLVVPYLADWCVVDVMAEDGSIQRLAIAHADPAKNEVARQMQRRYPTLSPQATHTIWKVLRTGQAWIDTEVSESRFVAEARDAEHLRLMRELGFRSEMVVPLLARGRALGTITFVRTTSQAYEPADLALAEELAQRVAIAVDNIRLYRQAQRVNADLEQRVTSRTAELQASHTRLEQEIAERLHAEQALRRSEEHLRSLIENASDIIAILDAHGTLRYVSPSVERILGYTPKSVLRKRVNTIVHADDVTQVLTTFQALLGRPGAMGSATFRLRHQDGSWRIFEAIGKNLLDEPAIGGFVVHTRDITERKRAEEQLQQQQEALAQSEKLAAMGSLLAGVAHELNNPLAVVVMEANLLSEESAGGPLAEHARKITQAAERCVALVQNFLALARQHPPERVQVPLNALIAEALELLAYPLQVDNIEVSLHLANDLPPLWADPNQLRQVLINLVTNAHQALRETSPPRQLTLSTHTDAARAHVLLSVGDTGPGIPLDIQTRIFEPFFTTKPVGVGTGLGLSLCRGIIEAHGGNISVQSHPGHGANFLVTLPLEAAPMSVPAPPPPAETKSRHGKAILVVDDEPGIRGALAHLLRRDGHRVETAANGHLALLQIQEKAFDLILCDLRMPQLDGPGLYRELEAHQPHLLRHMIFLTGDTLSVETKKFLEGIDTPRLTKPFTVAEARRVVEQALQAAPGSG
jgi:two-component system NtrC family sensor kinase